MRVKKYLLITLCALLIFTAGCASNPDPKPPPEPTPSMELPDTIHGTIAMEDGGVIAFELYPKIAPISVLNFVSLVQQGYYDGLAFHRIMKTYMIQGGCPDGTGTGGPGYTIKGEFSSNGVPNSLSHTRGALSMARKDDYDSAGSQFFIVHEDRTGWDGAYAAFGMVINGMDVVDRLADTPSEAGSGRVAENDRPVIKAITIDDGFKLP